MNAGRPIASQPIANRTRNRDFVYFGTGRFFHQEDASTNKQEKYIGVMEPINSDFTSSINESTLLDVTDIDVDEDGQVFDGPTGINTFSKLQNHIITDPALNGWKRLLRTYSDEPNERVSENSVLVRTQLFFNSFTPTDNICSANSGTADLYGVNLITGTASPFGGLGFTGDIANTSLNLGEGRPSAPLFVNTPGRGPNKGVLVIQMDNGKLITPEVVLGESVEIQRLNWREIRAN